MIKKMIPALAAAFCCLCITAFAGGTGKSAYIPVRQSAAPGPGVTQVSAGVRIPDTARMLTVVEGSGSEDHGVLSVYTRDELADGSISGWTLRLTTNAMLGKSGLYKEKEGDCKTPVGLFLMNTPFGILPRQEGFSDNYLQVDSHHYWNGDSASPMYNRMVRSDQYSDFSKKASEHLVDYGGYYDYCIDSGYNPEGTPGRGSAIFLHCSVNGQNTHGCIAIPSADMIRVLQLYREGSSYMLIWDRNDPSTGPGPLN